MEITLLTKEDEVIWVNIHENGENSSAIAKGNVNSQCSDQTVC